MRDGVREAIPRVLDPQGTLLSCVSPSLPEGPLRNGALTVHSLNLLIDRPLMALLPSLPPPPM